MPLLEGLDGVQKMSKSLGNYIGITEAPEEMFGKLMSISDPLMWRYYELLSDKSIEEIAALKRNVEHGSLHPMEAKKALATEATAMVHGRAAADQAADTARRTFEEGALAETLPTIEVARAELERGIGVLTAFAEKAQLVSSNGEARRQIKGGGLRVNDASVTDEKMTLTPAILTPQGVIKLSLGRKKHVLIRPV